MTMLHTPKSSTASATADATLTVRPASVLFESSRKLSLPLQHYRRQPIEPRQDQRETVDASEIPEERIREQRGDGTGKQYAGEALRCRHRHHCPEGCIQMTRLNARRWIRDSEKSAVTQNSANVVRARTSDTIPKSSGLSRRARRKREVAPSKAAPTDSMSAQPIERDVRSRLMACRIMSTPYSVTCLSVRFQPRKRPCTSSFPSLRASIRTLRSPVCQRSPLEKQVPQVIRRVRAARTLATASNWMETQHPPAYEGQNGDRVVTASDALFAVPRDSQGAVVNKIRHKCMKNLTRRSDPTSAWSVPAGAQPVTNQETRNRAEKIESRSVVIRK